MIKLKFVSANKANIICHSGRFHADDVFSTVILSKIYGNKLKIARINNSDCQINTKAILYDIGLGKFDHHQKGGNGIRENGIPYASCGLLWKEFGIDICKKNTPEYKYCYKEMDKFISGIDAYDNGLFHKDNTPIRNLSNCISSFNSSWDMNNSYTQNKAFAAAVNCAETIFDNEFKNIVSNAKAREILRETLSKTQGDVLILEKYMPYYVLPEIKRTINFILYPSERGGFNLEIINKNLQFDSKISGLSGENLKIATNIISASFIHNNGRLAGADTLFGIIQLLNMVRL